MSSGSMYKSMRQRYLVWFDIETTGLDPKKDDVLEFCCKVTAGKPTMHVVGDKVSCWWEIICASSGVLSSLMVEKDSERFKMLHPIVKEMHEKSGLFNDVRAVNALEDPSEAYVDRADEALSGMLEKLAASSREGGMKPEFMLAGNSVHFDRSFAREVFPRFEAMLFHRHFDVSSSCEVLESMHFDDPCGWNDKRPPVAHRAADDVDMSMTMQMRMWENLSCRGLVGPVHDFVAPLLERAIAIVVAASKKAKKKDTNMARKTLLVQGQYSNYDAFGQFILEADSGFQMVIGRVREMLKVNPDLHVTVTIPKDHLTSPINVCSDLRKFITPRSYEDGQRLKFIELNIPANALRSRFEFDMSELADAAQLNDRKNGKLPRFDAVYVNDPLHLRNLKATFQIYDPGCPPPFFVHSHFIDNPECPKFPQEASLWLGQCEAALRADYNFWQCKSSMDTFLNSMSKTFSREATFSVLEKSCPWDDGYSQAEVDSYDVGEVAGINSMLIPFTNRNEKTIIFVPNRVGGEGRSSDYTNCGHFLFKVIPELYKQRQDFIVIAGNPSQKFSNQEIAERVGPAYVDLFPGRVPTRKEYLALIRCVDIAVGLYNQDTYGGTAARECVVAGAYPLWLNCNEYARLSRSDASNQGYGSKSDAATKRLNRENDWSNYDVLVSDDLSDLVSVTSRLLDLLQSDDESVRNDLLDAAVNLRKRIKEKCSYEATTKNMMGIMDLW